MSKYKDYDLSVDAQQLVDIFADYDIQTKLQPKLTEYRWDVRYIWKAVKSHGDDQGEEYECEWEGFETVNEMLFDMVNVLSANKKIMNKYKDWQPIETAPKNLNQLMLCCGSYICIGCWDGHWAEWEDSSSGLRLTPQPGHWMNMPELPNND